MSEKIIFSIALVFFATLFLALGYPFLKVSIILEGWSAWFTIVLLILGVSLCGFFGWAIWRAWKQ